MAKLSLFEKRRRRVRTSLLAKRGLRARLSVHRSGRHIYAQVIDDEAGKTLVAASTLEKGVIEGLGFTGNIEAARAVGQAIAEKAKAAGISEVAFDRSGFKYHGRVASLADGAREGGLKF